MSAADRSLRLGPSPTELIARSRRVSFEFEGGPIEAYEGDKKIGNAIHKRAVIPTNPDA